MANEYWRRRAKELESEWQARCESELEVELARYFRESLKEIEDDVAALYGRYAAENGLTYAAAKRLIRGQEFTSWRMSLKEYVALSHADSAILKELNTLAMRGRISRLEKLYAETLKELQRLGERSESAVTDFLTTAYKERYYRGIYDLASVGKLEIPVAKVEPAKLEKVLASRWQGGNYSTRIWKNTEKLAKTLKSTLTSGLHRGLSVQKMAKAINAEMNSGYKNAERLVRTELNFIQNQSARESMEAAGLNEYEFIATLDNRTSQRCRSLDGTVHLLEEYDPGTNAPPMHPRCRSTISAVINEGTRTAKVRGRNIRVPAEMKYAEFKAVYVDKAKDWQSVKLINFGQEISYKPQNTLPVRENVASGSSTADMANEHGAITREQIFNTDKITININGIGEAHIPTAKLTKYALNPDKAPDKARAFELALGYTLDNVEKLVGNIIKHLNEYEVVRRPKTQYGEPFEIAMELEGENGKTARVTTGWIIDAEKGEVRLTSIYVDKRKK